MTNRTIVGKTDQLFELKYDGNLVTAMVLRQSLLGLGDAVGFVLVSCFW